MLAVACGLVVVASHVRVAFTGALTVDAPRLGGSRAALVAALFWAGLGLGACAAARVVRRARGWDLRPRETLRLGVALFVGSSLSLPLLSNDVFSYLAFGDVVLRGVNPYVTPGSVARSAFAASVTPMVGGLLDGGHVTAPAAAADRCQYGPVGLLVAATSVALGRSLLGSLLVHKALALAVGLAALALAARWVEEGEPDPPPPHNGLALFALAPVVWIYGAGGAHFDLHGAALLLALLLLVRRRRYALAAVALALGLLIKVTFLMFLPLVALHGAITAGGRARVAVRRTAAVLGVVALVSGLAYAPVWAGPRTVLDPLGTIADKPPSTSHVEVLTDVAYLGGLTLRGESPPRGFDAQRAAKRPIQRALAALLSLFGALLAAWQLVELRRIRDPEELEQLFGRITVVAFCFFSAAFHPWYFLLTLPLFLRTRAAGWVSWLLLVPSLSASFEILQVIERDDPLIAVTAALIGLSVASFWYRFWPHLVLEPLRGSTPAVGPRSRAAVAGPRPP
ncbi:MAG: hypothetical protein ACFCGT_21755 [Sandaracinaceae bacterium]